MPRPGYPSGRCDSNYRWRKPVKWGEGGCEDGVGIKPGQPQTGRRHGPSFAIPNHSNKSRGRFPPGRAKVFLPPSLTPFRYQKRAIRGGGSQVVLGMGTGCSISPVLSRGKRCDASGGERSWEKQTSRGWGLVDPTAEKRSARSDHRSTFTTATKHHHHHTPYSKGIAHASARARQHFNSMPTISPAEGSPAARNHSEREKNGLLKDVISNTTIRCKIGLHCRTPRRVSAYSRRVTGSGRKSQKLHSYESASRETESHPLSVRSCATDQRLEPS